MEAGSYITFEREASFAFSVFLARTESIAQNGISQELGIPDMSYESLVQLEDVRCVASSAFVSSLPVCTFKNKQLTSPGLDSELCVICQAEYEHGEAQLKLPCQHNFHQACGATWFLNYSKRCPVCKHDITEADTTDADSKHKRSQRGGR